MLTQTQQLQQIFTRSDRTNYAVVTAYVNAVAQLGNQEDLAVVLDLFLADPTDYKRQYLLFVLQSLGNMEVAEALHQKCFEDDMLKADMPEEVLNCLVWLEYPPTEALLIRNYENKTLDHGGHFSLCMGLLHYDGAPYQEMYIREVEKCIGKGIFDNEFAPALVCKVASPKREELLEKLYHSGKTVTSTDCNGGIVIGLALSGQRGEELFRELLWDERWETYGGGTGTDSKTYTGLEYLGITMSDLYDEILANVANSHVEADYITYQLRVFKSMLGYRLLRGYNPKDWSGRSYLKFVPPPSDRLVDLHQKLFTWSTPHKDDALNGIAHQFSQGKIEFYEEAQQLRRLIKEEVLYRG